MAADKKYKVIVLQVSGRGNKTFEAGETVTDKHFPDGHAELLVKEKKLAPIKDSKADLKEKKDLATAAFKEAEEKLKEAKEILKKASPEEKEDAEKNVEDAQLSLDIAKEELDKLK